MQNLNLKLRLILDPSQFDSDFKTWSSNIRKTPITVPVNFVETTKPGKNPVSLPNLPKPNQNVIKVQIVSESIKDIENSTKQALKTSVSVNNSKTTLETTLDILSSVVKSANETLKTVVNSVNGFISIVKNLSGFSQKTNKTELTSKSVSDLKIAVDQSLSDSISNSNDFKTTIQDAVASDKKGSSSSGGIVDTILKGILFIPVLIGVKIKETLQSTLDKFVNKIVSAILKPIQSALRPIFNLFYNDQVLQGIDDLNNSLKTFINSSVITPPELKSILNDTVDSLAGNLKGFILTRPQLVAELSKFKEQGLTNIDLRSSESKLRSEYFKLINNLEDVERAVRDSDCCDNGNPPRSSVSEFRNPSAFTPTLPNEIRLGELEPLIIHPEIRLGDLDPIFVNPEIRLGELEPLIIHPEIRLGDLDPIFVNPEIRLGENESIINRPQVERDQLNVNKDFWSNRQLDIDSEFKKSVENLSTKLSGLTVKQIEALADYFEIKIKKSSLKQDKIDSVLKSFELSGNLLPLDDAITQSLSLNLKTSLEDVLKQSNNSIKNYVKDTVKTFTSKSSTLLSSLDITSDESLEALNEFEDTLNEARLFLITLSTKLKDKNLSKTISGYRLQVDSLKSDIQTSIKDAQKAQSEELINTVRSVPENQSVQTRLAQVQQGVNLGRTDVDLKLDNFYESLVDIVAKISSFTGDIKLPTLSPNSQMGDNVSASYIPENNQIQVPQRVYEQINLGEITPEIVSALTHEIRHALQFKFGELTIDQAALQNLIAPTLDELDKINEAVNASISSVETSSENLENITRLEQDAYTFQLRVLSSVEDILNRLSQSGVTLDDSEINDFINQTRNNVEQLDVQTSSTNDIFQEIGETINDTTNNLNAQEFSIKNIGKAAIEAAKGFAAWSIYEFLEDRWHEFAVTVIDTYSQFEILERRIEFGSNNAKQILNDLFESSQKLGVSFSESASGYASFSAAIKGTSLESVSSEVFLDISTAIGSMGMSAQDAQGVFTALTQMASKGVVSMEELRGQLAERLPQGFSATVKAVNDMIKDGLIKPEEINKSLIGASEEVRKAYQATGQDVNKYISQGLLSSIEFLPYFTKRMKEGLITPTSSYQQSLIRVKNEIEKIYAILGKALAPVLTDILWVLSIALKAVSKNAEILGQILTGAMTFSLGMAGVALIKYTKALQLAGLQTLLFKAISLTSINSIKMAFTALLASNPVTLFVLLASVLASVAEPAAKMFANALNGTNNELLKLSDNLANVSNKLDNTFNKIARGEIVDVSEIKRQRKELIDLAGGADKIIDIQNKVRQNGVISLTVEERGIYESLNLLRVYEALNLKRIQTTSVLEGKLQDLKVATDNLNHAEKQNLLINKEKLASGEIDKAEFDRNMLNSEISITKQRLELAKQTKARLAETDTTSLSTDAAAEHLKTVLETDEAIYENRIKLADLTVQLREETLNAEIERVEKASNKLQKAYEYAELSRMWHVKQAYNEGNINIAQAENERIALTQERLNKEYDIENEHIKRLKFLRDQIKPGTENEPLLNPDEINALNEQILEAEQRKWDIIKENSDLELERLEIQQRKVEAQIVGLETDKQELEIKAELLAIANELTVAQNDLVIAQNEFATARLSLEQTYAQLELDRINTALEASEVLLSLDKERRDMIAERLGIESNTNEIEILRERVAQEEQISQIKYDQLLLQQQSEKQQLEFQRTQIKFEAEQEKYRLKAAKIEAQISKMKAEQAVSSAIAARNEALATGDTKAAAEAELEILQARQQSNFADDQLNLINQQNRALGQQTQIQNKILNAQEQTLEVTQEQQRTEFELEQIAINRSNLLETERALIEETVKARSLARQEALFALQYSTDEAKNQAEIIQNQLELNDLQEQYSNQSAYVEQLRASGVEYADEQVILTRESNELRELGLGLLEAEYKLEESLANEVAQEREASLQRQNDILNQRKSLLEAELGLSQAQSDLEQAKLDRRLIEIDRKEGLGQLDTEDAEKARFKIEKDRIQLEAEMLSEQQKADLKRLEIEQQIEVMRLRASQAETEVVKARAEATLAESQGALSRAIESGDQDAINAAEAAIDASEKGIEAASTQVDLIGEQIDQTLELQQLQLETIETQQKADIERLKNRERELEIAREIAQYEAQQAQNAADEAEGNDTTGNRVSGGGVSAGKSYIVGEQGQELFQGVDGSTKLLGVNGQHAFTPNVPGKIISNQALEQVIAANVMRSDSAVVEAIQRGFKTSGTEFARLAGILANRITKPAVITNNYGSEGSPSIDLNRLKLSRL